VSELHQILRDVVCGRDSVLLWRRRIKLCTSDFVDDVIVGSIAACRVGFMSKTA